MWPTRMQLCIAKRNVIKLYMFATCVAYIIIYFITMHLKLAFNNDQKN